MDQKLQIDLIRKVLRKKGEEGFSLIELVVVVAVLAVLSSIAIPSFNCFPKKAKATAALAALRQINTECQQNRMMNSNQGFTSSSLDEYTIQTSGSNSCNGVDGVISAVPANTNELPTFNLASATGLLTYNFKGIVGADFSQCLASICGNSSSAFGTVSLSDFNTNFNSLASKGLTLEDEFYRRGDSIYVVVQGDTWEKARENANKLGGTLATINDKSESDWLVNQLYGDNKASSKLIDRLALPGEPLRGTSVWLGHTNQNGSGEYQSVSGDKNIYNNWGAGEEADGISKGEEYTILNLYNNSSRDPGNIGTASDRQYNTQQLQERGGAHIFYGLAEIKINENNDVNDEALND